MESTTHSNWPRRDGLAPLSQSRGRRQGATETAPMGCGPGEAQVALAPNNAGQFLDKLLFGRSMWVLLGHQRRDQGVVFAGIPPVQHRIARQHAMAQRVEADDLRAAGLCRQRGLGFAHFRLLRFVLSILASSRSVRIPKASSASVSAWRACSLSRSWVRRHMPFGLGDKDASKPGSPPRRCLILSARRSARSHTAALWLAYARR